MKKQLLSLALASALLSAVLASCSVKSSAPVKETTTIHAAMAYSEKASFYDALVAGDSDPIPLTTVLNKSVSIEGDPNLLEEEVFNKIVTIANEVYPLMSARYRPNGTLNVTITLDASSASYSSCYTVGNTVLLNTDWLNKHPTECDILIDGFAAIILDYGQKDEIPPWLVDAMRVYVRDEFAYYRSESSFSLPKRYNGKSYEDDTYTAAAFLKWIKASQDVDIMGRLNSQMRSINGYQERVWVDATGKTLYQLWEEYKRA